MEKREKNVRKEKRCLRPKRGVRVIQHYNNDCGAASFVSLAAWYGLKLSREEVRQLSGTSHEGTTIAGLITAAGHFGFETGGYKGGTDSLHLLDIPAILHFRKNDGRLHFVVFYGCRGKKFRIMDPGDGHIHYLKEAEVLKQWSSYLVLPVKGKDFTAGDRRVKIVKNLLDLIKGDRKFIFILFSLSGIYLLTSFAVAFLIKYITDTVLPEQNKGLLAGVAVSAVFIIVLSFIIEYSKSKIALGVGLRSDKKLIMRLMSALLAMPQPFFDLRESGDITSRFYESSRVRSLISNLSVTIFTSFLTLISAILFMASMDLKLALLSLLSIPLYFSLWYFFDRAGKERIWKATEQGSSFESFINLFVRNIKSFKWLSLEQHTLLRAGNETDKLNKAIKRCGNLFITGGCLNETLTRSLTFFVLTAGSFAVIGGSLTQGGLMAFFTLIALFAAPLSGIAASGREIREGIISASRIFGICELEKETSSILSYDIPEKFETLSFDNVSFSFPGRDPLFENLSFTVRRGDFIHIKGKNGSGKSTIGSLLTVIYRPSSGNILLDSTDIGKFDPRKWREFTGIVPQKPDILPGTLLNNIVPGSEAIDLNKLEDVIRISSLGQLLKRLPAGYETLLTGLTMHLSRGELQRIAIARALYRKPKIIVLDEISASLDSDSAEIMKNCFDFFRDNDTTVFLISHNNTDPVFTNRCIEINTGEI